MELYTPNELVVVAVIDSGVDFTHPEFLTLQDGEVVDVRFYPNIGEGSQDDDIDNDENGFTDDHTGWDFIDDDNLPIDENGHGTLVASIIAALGNNGEGGAGIAPFTLISPIRAFDDFGGGITVDIFIESTKYVANLGIKIINASFGGPEKSQCEQDQVGWLEDQGILLVAAAGNGGQDQIGDNNDLLPQYPASYAGENVISVAAIDQNGELARFSNFGEKSVDLARIFRKKSIVDMLNC